MDALSITTTTIKGIGLLRQFGSWLHRKLGGSIEITEPQNRNTCKEQPWIKIKGTHSSPKGKFWLLTRDGDNYWPQTKITLQHDRVWSASVNVNTKNETRNCCIVLARVGGFGNDVFEDYRTRCKRTSDWFPMKITSPSSEMKVLQELVVIVLGSKQGGQSN